MTINPLASQSSGLETPNVSKLLFQLDWLNGRQAAAKAQHFVHNEAVFYDDLVDILLKKYTLPELEKLWPELSERIVRTTHPTNNLSAQRQFLLTARENYFVQLQQGNLPSEETAKIRRQVSRINARLKALPDFNELSALRPSLSPMDEFRQQLPVLKNSANTDAYAMAELKKAFLRRFGSELSPESPLLKHIILNERMWACVDNDRGPVTAQDALDMALEKNRHAFIVNAKKLQSLQKEIADPELAAEIRQLRLRVIATAGTKGHSYLQHAIKDKAIIPFANTQEYVDALEQLQARYKIGGPQQHLYEALIEPIDLVKRAGFHLSVGEGRHNAKDMDILSRAIARHQGIRLWGMSQAAQSQRLSAMFDGLAESPHALEFDDLKFKNAEERKHAKKVWDIFAAYGKANAEIDAFSIRNATIAECVPNRPYLLEAMRFLSIRHGMGEFARGKFEAASLLESPHAANTLIARISDRNAAEYVKRYFNASLDHIHNGLALVRQFFAGSDMLRAAGIAHGTFTNFAAVRALRRIYDNIVIYMGVGYDFQRSLSQDLAHYRMLMPNGLRKVDLTSQGIGFVAEHGTLATSKMSSGHNLAAQLMRSVGLGDERLTPEGDRLFQKFANISNRHYKRVVFNNPNVSPALNVLGRFWPALNGGARGHFGYLSEQKTLAHFKDLSMSGSRAIPLSGASAHIGIPEGGVGSGHAFHKMLTTRTGNISPTNLQKFHNLLQNDNGFRSVFELLKQHTETTDLDTIATHSPGLIQPDELAFRQRDQASLKKYITMIETNRVDAPEFKSTLSPMRQRIYTQMRQLALETSAAIREMHVSSTLENTSDAGKAVRKLLGIINVMISVRRRFG